jgi:hypothetical protein
MGQEFHHLTEEVLAKRLTLDEAIAEVSAPEIGYWLETTFDAALPFDADGELLLEEYVMIDSKGRRLTADQSSKAVSHGYLDVMTLLTPDTLLIVDWKSGRWEQDDIFERHSYAGLLGHAAFPQARVIRFQLRFVRSGHVLESVYTWEDERTVHIVDPRGKEFRMRDPKGPFLAWLGAVRNKIRLTKAEPRPGAHCTKWYGKPCIFHGAECPLSANLPAAMDDFVMQADPIAALMSIKNNVDIIPASAGLAYQAITQMEAVLDRIKDSIKDWSKTYGSFQVGDTPYGWGTKEKGIVDKKFVIEQLFESGLSYADIAKVINISRSSLKKLPAGDLRDVVFDLGIKTKPVPTFGTLNGTGEEEE